MREGATLMRRGFTIVHFRKILLFDAVFFSHEMIG